MLESKVRMPDGQGAVNEISGESGGRVKCGGKEEVEGKLEVNRDRGAQWRRGVSKEELVAG